MTNLPEKKREKITGMADLFAAKDRFLLATHVNPDGDAIGAALALAQGLTTLGKEVTVFAEGGVPYMYDFLPGVEDVVEDPGAPEDYDILVLMDCNSPGRAGNLIASMDGSLPTAVVDHHPADGRLPEHSLVDTQASAAGELVYLILKAMGVKVSPAMATNMFTAISTDTGSFCFDNTSDLALEVSADLVRAGAVPWDIFKRLNLNKPPGRLTLLSLALKDLEFFHQGRLATLTVTADMMDATGTSSIDTDGFIEYPRSIKGVELAALFREDGSGAWHVSLRSLGRINVATLARSFGGGGHSQAAGFNVFKPLEELKDELLAAALSYMPPVEGGEGR